MANVRFGSVPYYYTADQVEIPYRVQLSASGEGSPPEADVSEARIFLAGATEGAPAKVEQLVKNGENVLTLSLADFTPSTDSPVMVQFYFEKRWTSGPRSGTTDTHGETILGIPLAEPAVGEIEAAPNPCKPGDTVELRVKTWGAVIYERAGADPLLDLGTADEPVDTARWPSGAQGQTKWRLGQEKDETSEPYEDLSATGEQVTESITEDHGQLLHFQAFLGEQPEALRATTDVRGSRVALQLLFLDPDDPAPAKAIPLPQGLKVRAAYAGSEGSDVDLEADGKLTLLADRSKPALWLKLVNADTYVAYKADQTPKTKKLAKAEVDQHLKDGWFVFLLPGEFTTRMSVWTSPNAPTWQATGTLDRLDQADTALGAPAAPLKLILDPKWQHLRFVYFDRVLGEAEPVSIPTERDGADLLPPVVEGWDTLTGPKDASDAPKTRAFWPVGVADPKKAHLALPWIVQGTDDGTAAASVPEPKATTALRLQRAEDHPFVHTAANGTRKLVNLTDANVRDKPSADRMRYYDLPKVWLSRGYFAWLEDAAGKHGPFEDVATQATTKAKPLVVSFDDIVLTDEALAPLDPAKPAADPLHWDPSWRVALYRHDFQAPAAAVPASLGPATASGAGKPQAPAPPARRHVGRTGLYNPEMDAATATGPYSKVVMSVNYIADYPHWTRLVAVRGSLYDVFNKRLPLADTGVVGARAGVRWLDAMAELDASIYVHDTGAGAAAADRRPQPQRAFARAGQAAWQDLRPGRTDGPSTDPFFSIQPLFEQRHGKRYEGFDPAKHGGIGRYEQALVRCAGLDGANEVAVAVCFLRLSFDFSGTTGVADQAAYVRTMCEGIEGRWNGADAYATDPPRLLPVDPAAAIEAKVVRIVQGLPRVESATLVRIVDPPVGTSERGWMSGYDGTSEMGPSKDRPMATGWYTAAHEAGHAFALADEYNERWWGGSYGQLSLKWNIPGDPYEPDGRSVTGGTVADASVMGANMVPRNRHHWHVSEWAREATGVEFQVAQGTYTGYRLPRHPDRTAQTWMTWPVAHAIALEPAPGARGLCNVYLFALGQDRYTVDLLPGATPATPIDGILVVNVHVRATGMPADPPAPAAPDPALTKALREPIFDQIAADAASVMNAATFFATGSVQVDGAPRAFARCLIHFTLRLIDADYVPAPSEGTNAPNIAALTGTYGVHLDLDLNPTQLPNTPGPQWGAGPYPDEVFDALDWGARTAAGGGARDAVLQQIDGELAAYHGYSVAQHDERRSSLDRLATLSNQWLTTGDAASATPQAHTTTRRPELEALRARATARRDHYDAIKASRQLRVNHGSTIEAGATIAELFPTFVGVYKSPAALTANDLLPLVRAVITTNPNVTT